MSWPDRVPVPSALSTTSPTVAPKATSPVVRSSHMPARKYVPASELRVWMPIASAPVDSRGSMK